MDTIDKALEFVETTQRLGEQLKQAATQQQVMLAQMLRMKEDGQTEEDSYLQLSARSEALQAKIDHFKGIYAQNMAMLKEVHKRKQRQR